MKTGKTCRSKEDTFRRKMMKRAMKALRFYFGVLPKIKDYQNKIDTLACQSGMVVFWPLIISKK